MMIMDIIGTTIVHVIFGNKRYSDRIPTPKDIRVQKISGQYMSYKLLKYVTENLSNSDSGKIPAALYSDDNRLQEIDKATPRIKKAYGVKLNDGIMRRQLPFLRKYSSVQIEKMIRQTADCILQLNYPIRFFNGNDYQTILFNNFGLPSKLFTLVEVKITKKSKDGHILEREYDILMDTILGYLFMQNVISCYMDLLPGKFYEMTDYAQLFYRLFILSYFPNKKSGKSPKNPISLDEIKNRLVLKTPDSYMVRKIIKRILHELEENNFIGEPKEEKMDGKYVYRYKKNIWQTISKEDDNSESDLDFSGYLWFSFVKWTLTY
jgi:Txe/YoeB family toxin of Txe-Axe toxin-antitoxin module